MKILMAEHTHFEAVCRVGCHHLAEGLAKRGHEITYISSYLTPLHFLSSLTMRGRETRSRFLNWASGGEVSDSGVYSYVPFTFVPFAGIPLLDSMFAAGKQYRSTFPPLKKKAKTLL